MCRNFAVASVRRSAKTERVYEAREMGVNINMACLTLTTHAGQPMVIPNTASIVSPFPYPKALYLCKDPRYHVETMSTVWRKRLTLQERIEGIQSQPRSEGTRRRQLLRAYK